MQKSSGRKEKRTLQNFRLTVEEICAKIKNILEFMKSQQFLNGRSLVLKESKRLVLHIVPRKIRGILKFGTDDPCVTGQILAAASIFYPLYGEHFTIEPYFDRNILEGEIYVRGRIYGMALLRMAWNLFWDSDVRYIVKKFKQH